VKGANKYARVARARTQKLDTSTLHTTGVPGRPFRISNVAVFFSNFTIIARVAVYQDTNHAKFLGTLNLEASEDASIFGNGNLSLEVDAGGN
jgi:hypothetical protein